MKRATLIAAIGFCLSFVGDLAAGDANLKVTSSAFSEGGNIPSKFTCEGANTSPPLQIEGVPAEAKSLALIIEDPDAPNGLFRHLVVWNLDPKTTSFSEGKLPGGVEGTNDFGNAGYGGPCPPSGTHRYFFKVFALDQKLNVPAGARRKQLDAAMKGHVIAQGELMGKYAKQK